ncbi:hypothetical protein SRABI128_05309 [Microbacterium sp. Bi128]|nr:hypothetical protein SRABI128_05309 [Microbacterium sp. Bi128]
MSAFDTHTLLFEKNWTPTLKFDHNRYQCHERGREENKSGRYDDVKESFCHSLTALQRGSSDVNQRQTGDLLCVNSRSRYVG